MFAEDFGVFQKFAARDHGVKLGVRHKIITFPTGFSRAARPGGNGNGAHRPGKLQDFLDQSRLTRTRRPGHDEHERCNGLLRAHSMFCTCSRSFSISARISSDNPVIASASVSTPGVLDSMVFASRCISWSKKSSFLPSSPAPSTRFQ